MAFRFRKSVKIAPGIKLNFNKKSTGVTFGGKGVNYTINSKGKRTKSVGIPGTGLYYTTSNNNSKKKSSKSTNATTNESYENTENKANNNISTKKWYQKSWFIILMLIYFFPVGIYLMWKHSNWKKISKLIITSVYIFFALLFAIGLSSNDTEISSASGNNPDDTTIAAIIGESETESETEESTVQQETTNQEQTTTQKPTTTKKQTTTKQEITTEKCTATQNESTTEKQTTTQKQTTTKKESIENQDKTEMVWIPQSGKKYHSSAGCSGMKNPSQVALDKAKSLGFTACQRCY